MSRSITALLAALCLGATAHAADTVEPPSAIDTLKQKTGKLLMNVKPFMVEGAYSQFHPLLQSVREQQGPRRVPLASGRGAPAPSALSAPAPGAQAGAEASAGNAPPRKRRRRRRKPVAGDGSAAAATEPAAAPRAD